MFFIVILLVYIKIYIVFRKRRKRVNIKRSSRVFRVNLKILFKVFNFSFNMGFYLSIIKRVNIIYGLGLEYYSKVEV